MTVHDGSLTFLYVNEIFISNQFSPGNTNKALLGTLTSADNTAGRDKHRDHIKEITAPD